MGQVGDSFDLSWLVFDLTQQGAAMTKLYSEHGKNAFIKKMSKNRKKQNFICSLLGMQDILGTVVWVLFI